MLIQDTLCDAQEKQLKNHITALLRFSFSRLWHKELQSFKSTGRRVYNSTLIVLIVVFAVLLTT